MQVVSEIFLFLKARLNKYWITAIVFFVFTFLVGESSMFNRISYNKQIRNLKEEIESYTQQKETNYHRLDALRSDNENLEKLAREQYRMTKPNEELFIIKE